jgi:hypothetical protein
MSVKCTAIGGINLVGRVFIKNPLSGIHVFNLGAHASSDEEIKVRAVFPWLRMFHPCPFYQHAMKPEVLPERREHLYDHTTCVESAVIDINNISDVYSSLKCVTAQEKKPGWSIKCQVAYVLDRRCKGIKALQGCQVHSACFLLAG